MHEVLVLYYSDKGATRQLAKLISRGIESIDGVSARVRTVPKVSTVCEKVELDIPENGDAFVTLQDLKECIGLALGSPVRFGNMASSMKYFWDSTVSTWLQGELSSKPATVFCSGGSMHGGQETMLFSMMIPLLHHGMYIVGLPYSHEELSNTQSGGTPYGVTHVAGHSGDSPITKEEKVLAIAQGKRLAQASLKLIKE